MINQFKDEYEFLSNFYPSRIIIYGYAYKTAEHAFQALKTENTIDRLWVAEAPTPKQAKHRGKKVELRPEWDEVRLNFMYAILAIKFSKPELRDKLVATGNEKLIEGNFWHDNFWGDCFCNSCPEAGQNNLGKLLMDRREVIRS